MMDNRKAAGQKKLPSRQKRSLLVALVAVLLWSCAQPPGLVFLSPDDEGIVSGMVRLVVAPKGDAAPVKNVVFKLDGKPIAKAYPNEEGHYTALWNSRTVEPGQYLLAAKPFGRSALRIRVTVGALIVSE